MSAAEIGKTIESIKIGKKKVAINLDDGSSFVLSHNAFTERPLYVGKQLSKEDIESIENLSNMDKYLSGALSYCVKEPHTIFEVRCYLIKKGAEKEVREEIVSKLIEEGLLDDALYAKTYARDTAGLRLFGKNRILFNLKEKGISDDILSQLDFDEGRELSKARRYARLANTKYAKNTNVKKMYKVIAALLRRGFDQEIAQEAARLEFTVGDPKLEQERLRIEAQRLRGRLATKLSGEALHRKVVESLLRKGYRYENIKEAMKEVENEDN